MANSELNVDPEKLLLAIHQNLTGHFFNGPKTEAKAAFNQLRDGKQLPLLEIKSPELGDVVGKLALDFSEFVGNLNYSAFRDALASHLNHVADRLQNEKGPNIFSSEDSGAMLFHIPGVVEVDNQPNFLVTGLQQTKPGELTVKLMFLDPKNYTAKPEDAH